MYHRKPNLTTDLHALEKAMRCGKGRIARKIGRVWKNSWNGDPIRRTGYRMEIRANHQDVECEYKERDSSCWLDRWILAPDKESLIDENVRS
jgi:hypothetical protein